MINQNHQVRLSNLVKFITRCNFVTGTVMTVACILLTVDITEPHYPVMDQPGR